MGSMTRRPLALLELPRELLIKIFNHALEPSMIHTCRTLYRLLPDFIVFEQTLLLCAYESDDMLNVDENYKAAKLPGQSETIAVSDREELQMVLAKSHWLRVQHLKWTYVTLSQRLWQTVLIDNPDIQLKPEHIKAIHFVSERLPEDSISVFENFTDATCTAYKGTSYEGVIDMHIKMYDCFIFTTSNPNGGYERGTYSAFARVRYIPDCLMVYEPVVKAYSLTSCLREQFIRQAAIEANPNTADSIILTLGRRNLARSISCDEKLLAAQIWGTLSPSAPDTNDRTLWPWLALNYSCGSPVKYTYEMFRACLRFGMIKCLDGLVEFACHRIEGDGLDALTERCPVEASVVLALERLLEEAEAMRLDPRAEIVKAIGGHSWHLRYICFRNERVYWTSRFQGEPRGSKKTSMPDRASDTAN
ncbi:uncharacterized protein AB675_5678 [Cyphellophora attinorum]|uniref:F-box domain-containing protein n=1 Tax=Cyphellophora attinorum TaxID=1664694 RepID=A0A0N1HT84_9EURO|nr:uncharacterized protein AB675_5678 [Phialophora attinorum]KPI42127.1 hypothetical protein AB675_5678 [Phialophora attinorum]